MLFYLGFYMCAFISRFFMSKFLNDIEVTITEYITTYGT